jgi:hypothetical protein
MCLMNGIFRNYFDKFLIVLWDDILIYSKYEKDHEKRLRMVLQVLKEHRLYAKLRKCSFYERQIHYLGHIILEEGIEVDPKKIKSIEGWSIVRNFLEVRSLMGITSYYRRFVKGFSKIAHPINYLQKKGVRIECTYDCEIIFRTSRIY